MNLIIILLLYKHHDFVYLITILLWYIVTAFSVQNLCLQPVHYWGEATQCCHSTKILNVYI